MLIIKNLQVRAEGKEILKGIDLTVNAGEVHAIMGPNGSGKSTLARAISGHPEYEVTGGEILYNGADLLDMDPDERVRIMRSVVDHPLVARLTAARRASRCRSLAAATVASRSARVAIGNSDE